MTLKSTSIALIIPDFDFGGEEKRVVFFANNYVRYFKKVYVISPVGKSNVLLDPNVVHIDLKVRGYKNLFHVLRLLKEYDVRFLQGHKRATMPYLFSAQYFLSIHSTFNFDNIYLAGNTLYKYITPRNVIYLSDVLKDYYKVYYPKHINTTINMGGDFYNVYPEEKRAKLKSELGITNEFVILSLGRLSDQKNHKMLIDSLKSISSVNYVCLIAGTGELESELKELVRGLDISKKIKFLGHRSDIEELLNLSDVIVQSSIFEGFPNALIEAASVCLPIIATNVGSTSTLIKNNGILIESKDYLKLADAIISVHDSYSNYRNAAIEFSETNFFKQFHKDKMLNNYIKYYNNV